MASLSLPAPVLSAFAANDVTTGILRTVLLAAQEGGVTRTVHTDLTTTLFVEGLGLLAQVYHFAFLGLEVATEPGSMIKVQVFYMV